MAWQSKYSKVSWLCPLQVDTPFESVSVSLDALTVKTYDWCRIDCKDEALDLLSTCKTHPCITTFHLSYRFPILETSATAPCGTTGIVSKDEDMPSTCKDQSDVALNSDKWVFEVLGACPWTGVPQSTPILAQIWWILTGSRANVKAPVVVLGPWRHGTERCPPPIPTGLRRICSCPAGCHYPCGSLQGDAGSQAPAQNTNASLCWFSGRLA